MNDDNAIEALRAKKTPRTPHLELEPRDISDRPAVLERRKQWAAI